MIQRSCGSYDSNRTAAGVYKICTITKLKANGFDDYPLAQQQRH